MLQLPRRFDGRITVSLREAGALLGVSAKTIYNGLHSGSFPLAPIRIGRHIFFSIEDLGNLVCSKRGEPVNRV